MKFNLFTKSNKKGREEEKTIVSTLYSYEWEENIPNDEKDTVQFPSRPFCKKMMELNRYYSRKDIEEISERLGYSVWDRKGGDDCRHRWVSNIVVRKS